MELGRKLKDQTIEGSGRRLSVQKKDIRSKPEQIPTLRLVLIALFLRRRAPIWGSKSGESNWCKKKSVVIFVRVTVKKRKRFENFQNYKQSGKRELTRQGGLK